MNKEYEVHDFPSIQEWNQPEPWNEDLLGPKDSSKTILHLDQIKRDLYPPAYVFPVDISVECQVIDDQGETP